MKEKNKKNSEEEDEENQIEQNSILDSTFKSNLKFNSELLNKPFMKNYEGNNSNLVKENLLAESSSSFFKNENNTGNISMISFSGSLSNFNKSNEFNINASERKPFKKLCGFNLSNSNIETEGNNNVFEVGKIKNKNDINNNEDISFNNNANTITDSKKTSFISGSCLKDELTKINKLNKQKTLNDLAVSDSSKNINKLSTSKNPQKNFNFNSINKDKANLKKELETLKKSALSKLENPDISYEIDNKKPTTARNQNLSNNNLNLNSFSQITENSKIEKNFNKEKTILNDSRFSNSKNSINSINEFNLKEYQSNYPEKLSKNKNLNSNSKQKKLLESNSNINYLEETIFSEKNKNTKNFEEKNPEEISAVQFSTTNLNNTSDIINISKAEMSFIMQKSKVLTAETLEKARLYNSQFGDSIPFWIKFFLNKNDNLTSMSIESKSSYFKATDKKEYIRNLAEMVKKDAELYDKNNKHINIKFEGKNKLKSLLLTEVRMENSNKNPFNSIANSQSQINSSDFIEEESKSFTNFEEENQISLSENTNNLSKLELEKLKEDPINEKICNVLSQYEKIEKKEEKIKVENFGDFKKRLAKNERLEKFTNRGFEKSKIVQAAISKFSYPNIEGAKESYRNEYKNRTIDNLNFKFFNSENENENFDYENFDNFAEIDYDDIELGCLDTNDLKRIFAIDKELNLLDPEKYKTSINLELLKIQQEFNKEKSSRISEIEKEYKRKVEKIKDKEISRPSIFDVKENKDEKGKVKYKDYLKEKKEKDEIVWRFKKEIYDIDDKIMQNKQKEIPQEKKDELFNRLEIYYKENPEKYLKEINKKIPEDYNFDKAENEMKDLNKDMENLKKEIEDFENNKNSKNNLNDDEERKIKDFYKQEMLDNYKTAIDKLDLMKKDNDEQINKVEDLERKMEESQKMKEEMDNRYALLMEDKENFESNLDNLDKLLNEEYDFESGVDEDEFKNYDFSELEKKAFYEEEEI